MGARNIARVEISAPEVRRAGQRLNAIGADAEHLERVLIGAVAVQVNIAVGIDHRGGVLG